VLGRLRLSLFPGTQRYTLTAPGDWPSCNPSIAKDGDGFRVIVRTVNYRLEANGRWLGQPPGGARTVNWLFRLDHDLQTLSSNRIADRDLIAGDSRAGNGLEDGRLFFWRGSWWMVASAARFVSDSTLATMCLLRLDGDHRVAEAHFIESPLRQEKEKNWMPVVADDALKLIYRISPLQIVDVAEDWQPGLQSRGEQRADIQEWAGSSQLVAYRGNWLCVVHKRFEEEKYAYYGHAFVELSRDFKILRVSQPWHFDESTVEFCAGLCLAGDSAILSYGHMDREAKLLKLPLAIVERLLADTWRSRLALRLAYFRGRKS
jgi:hypothetical protein